MNLNQKSVGNKNETNLRLETNFLFSRLPTFTVVATTNFSCKIDFQKGEKPTAQATRDGKERYRKLLWFVRAPGKVQQRKAQRRKSTFASSIRLVERNNFQGRLEEKRGCSFSVLSSAARRKIKIVCLARPLCWRFAQFVWRLVLWWSNPFPYCRCRFKKIIFSY